MLPSNIEILLEFSSTLSLPILNPLRKKCPYSGYSGRHFPALELNTRDTSYLSIFSGNRENTEQNNSEYAHF